MSHASARDNVTQSMSPVGAIDRGSESFSRVAWADVYAELSAADQEEALAPEDLERLAVAAYLIGRDADSSDTWERAHQDCLRRGDTARAARCAFWLAFGLLNQGEMARGGGWLSRAQRLLDEAQLDCVERGYLLVPIAIGCFYEGDVATADATFNQAAEIGRRFSEPTLVALARLGQGRVLMRTGHVTEGCALLDEVMVGTMAGEVSSIAVGDVYCTVIEACQEIFDLRRAEEWTAALTRWCDSQTGLVPYRGQCMVHRAEIMQMHGDWPGALDEARRACERLSQPSVHPAVGAAFYRLAELQRLRGEFAEAERAYRRAGDAGRTPQPGLAQLRLAQGQVDTAEAAIRRALDEAQDRLTRSTLLAAYVEIVLAAGDVIGARRAAGELSEIAGELAAPFLRAAAAHATGAVLVAEGDARAALAQLRQSLSGWQALAAPYEAARVRILIGVACGELGDAEAWEMELSAARGVFLHLRAAADLARVDALLGKAAARAAGGLTGRELEVLRLVASGRTNRAIADSLFISEKTVARHVSNIFTKLGLSTRAAATAHAYKHGLV